MGCCSCEIFGVWRVTIQLVILLVAIFDLVADWLVFRTFYRYDEGSDKTNALLVFLIIASLLFLLEVRNAVKAIQIFNTHLMADLEDWTDGEVEEGQPNPRPRSKKIDMTVEEKSLNNWQEAVSFMLLAFEDLPVTIILWYVFEYGDEDCRLFSKLFDKGLAANLSLLGTLVSATGKLFLSLFFCIYKRVTCQQCKGDRKETCCCCCRINRPLLAIILITFAAALFVTYNETDDLDGKHPECGSVSVSGY